MLSKGLWWVPMFLANQAWGGYTTCGKRGEIRPRRNRKTEAGIELSSRKTLEIY